MKLSACAMFTCPNSMGCIAKKGSQTHWDAIRIDFKVFLRAWRRFNFSECTDFQLPVYKHLNMYKHIEYILTLSQTSCKDTFCKTCTRRSQGVHPLKMASCSMIEAENLVQQSPWVRRGMDFEFLFPICLKT